MKKILVLGAGRSAVTLIKYLLDNALVNNWFITVGDFSKKLADKSINNHHSAQSIFFDINDELQRKKEITSHHIVISMLPARMHFLVAKDCVKYSKDLVTASYVSDEINSLDQHAKDKGIILLNEIGLDPGIDHMSAMHVIDEIKDSGGKLVSFKSYCGGLIHPDNDNNPWNYKFTWNPRNVVLAGQGTAQYIEDKKFKYIPYHKLFQRIDLIPVLDAGLFEGYANRDSLSYRKLYGIEDIQTMLRGTLRREGYCLSWNAFIELGMTDDSYFIKNINKMTNRDFTNLFLPYSKNSLEDNLCQYLSISRDSNIFKKLEWLGLFNNEMIKFEDATPAQILQSILEKKWKLSKYDKDMVVMQHQFKYYNNNLLVKRNSSLVVYGDDAISTAMAKTVGLPVAIAVKLILNGDISLKGVQIPTKKEFYVPILKELKEHGINFIEELI